MKIINFFGIIWLILYGLLVFSCDILRGSPYEVEAWTPGAGFHPEPGKIKISILLSHESDRVRAEQAFSLTEDRKKLKGDFSWEGKKFFFMPASPLEAGRDYFISLGTEAQDTRGISLEKPFEASFTTYPRGDRPGITGTSPEYEGVMSGNRGEFRICFSEPVKINSCMDSISFIPSAPGSWRLEDEGRTACFVPRDPWQAGSIYKVRVESNFTGLSGFPLGTEYSSVFTIGEDRVKPFLLEALAIFPEGKWDESKGTEVFAEKIFLGKPDDEPAAVYPDWENYTRLELVFSEPVDTSGLKNLLVSEPSVSLVMESLPGFHDRAVFGFSEYPQWGSTYLFRLSPGLKDENGNTNEEEYCFRIIATGPFSKPPVLRGIRLPMAPGNIPENPGNQEALNYSLADLFADLPIKSDENHYPFMEQTPAWIELYFETAGGTEIDIFSLMDLFRVESTNQALTFSPRSVLTENFSWADPEDGWENLQRIEIRGFLTNTVHNGIVTFHIPAGLRDKRGNRSTTDFRISLLK